MRNIKIGLIVVLSVIAFALCRVLVYGISGHNIYSAGGTNYGKVHLVLEEQADLDGIEAISVLYHMNSNDVFLYESDNDLVTIKEYSSFELGEDEISTVKVSGSTLEIKGKKRNFRKFLQFFSIGYEGSYTEVWIPASYNGKIDLETTSGNIISESGFALVEDFSAASSSGDLQISAISARNVMIASTSGNVVTEDIDTDIHGENGEISITTTSGDISLKRLTGEINMASTSGTIRVEDGISGNTQLASSSGDITVQCIDGDASISTTSGNVRILDGSGIRDISTTSGDIRLEGTDNYFGVSAASGDISVKTQKGAGVIDTISGDIRLELPQLTGDVNISSTSGEADLVLSGDNSFEFEANTASGDIDTFFDDDLEFSKRRTHARGIYGSNTQDCFVGIETSSGDVRITRN